MPSPSALNPETTTGNLKSTHPHEKAAGLPAVTQSLKHIGRESILRGTTSLLKMNQKGGFDCSSCAWPDPDDHRSAFEFCENGAKSTASETTSKKITDLFFIKYSVEQIAEKSDYWMERQGRLTQPMYLEKDSSHYLPISWEQAFEKIGMHLRNLENPNQALFYTSGRASNEAAFLYQLLARQYGTNNLPDCSNMCHESSGVALRESIGVGKGTVSLQDFDLAKVIFIFGQNPGTNHPRMLTTLQKAARQGATIVAVNPLKEAGLLAFSHPQEVDAFIGKSTPLADHFLQIKPNGDMPLLHGLMKAIFEKEAKDPCKHLDHSFIEEFTAGFEEVKKSVDSLEWSQIVEHSGISQEKIREIANLLTPRTPFISCWAMGLTQQQNAVATIQQISNLHLMLGALGRPGAGVCPVRGHSNVQGDRTMGIWEAAPESFLAALDKEFNFTSPREHGHHTVSAIEAMHNGEAKVFIALGGNFLSAAPDTEYTAEALRNCDLTVQISTKLNRSHVITGKEALILPCLVRSEKDLQREFGEQFVTVENSMGIVHSSEGHLPPISKHVMSETAIVANIAHHLFEGKSSTDWLGMARNYDRIRDHIENCIPGFDNFNSRVRKPGGFYLPNAVKDRKFNTHNQKANFVNAEFTPIQLQEDQFLLQTLRSHDQFNTTIYGLNDRYRGIHNERRIIFLNPQDMEKQKISPEQPVDITSYFSDKTRHAPNFLAIPYDLPRGCAAAYFPEANPLVPIDSFAEKSHTPTSKAVIVSIKASGL